MGLTTVFGFDLFNAMTKAKYHYTKNGCTLFIFYFNGCHPGVVFTIVQQNSKMSPSCSRLPEPIRLWII
jgi:hypothetical protein